MRALCLVGSLIVSSVLATSAAHAGDIEIVDSDGRPVSTPRHSPSTTAPGSRQSVASARFDAMFPDPSSAAWRGRQTARQQAAITQFLGQNQKKRDAVQTVARAQQPDNEAIRELQLRRAQQYGRLHSANNSYVKFQIRQATGLTDSYRNIQQSNPTFTGFSSGGGGRSLDRGAQ